MSQWAWAVVRGASARSRSESMAHSFSGRLVALILRRQPEVRVLAPGSSAARAVYCDRPHVVDNLYQYGGNSVVAIPLADAGVRTQRTSATQISHLDALEAESVFIMREVAAEFERPVLLFSGGKDSIVLLALAEKAFRPARFRSEERRVGKECRSRWSR